MSERRFYPIFGLKEFAEWSALTGEYFIDYGPQYREINHRKFFAGMAPEIKLAYRILDPAGGHRRHRPLVWPLFFEARQAPAREFYVRWASKK